jgi:plastocyanin
MEVPMLRTSFVALLLALGLVAGSARADDAVVHFGHNRIDPASITVKAGTTVRFHNDDEMPGGHVIMADDESWKSPPLAKGQDWSHKFEKPGTYIYLIKQHPSAKGKVVVE